MSSYISMTEDLDTYLAYFYCPSNASEYNFKMFIKKNTIATPTEGMLFYLANKTEYFLERIYPGYTIKEDSGSFIREIKHRTQLVFYRKGTK